MTLEFLPNYIDDYILRNFPHTSISWLGRISKLISMHVPRGSEAIEKYFGARPRYEFQFGLIWNGVCGALAACSGRFFLFR
ncbi:hypothetical protein KIN20_025140 [Parelaphostrongylus tenuis]|uniref:Uncharacterized protein n=1 Tax=Parelaphostrongylus tenuis TaxID=148309 RepID=A0AAD5MY17_PARTN|nr:hypothetical protein KIN20_025140 [Parelaphostrongylus tenuis]